MRELGLGGDAAQSKSMHRDAGDRRSARGNDNNGYSVCTYSASTPQVVYGENKNRYECISTLDYGMCRQPAIPDVPKALGLSVASVVVG